MIVWRLKRTHWCGELRRNHVGLEVILNGWVHAIRKVGKLTFILLRDRTGIVQVVITPKSPARKEAEKIDREYVLGVKGIVKSRPPKQVNPLMPTGEIEVIAQNLEILNTSKPLPIPIWDEELMKNTSESNRLRFRYLDLRRAKVRDIIVFRAEVTNAFREYYRSHGFIEVETPYLARSTPEGARDFLVPSRLHPGKFYALTQSPQLFKQLLMVAGFERYFQVARCFRDEDPRADRQPEFTQLDIEMSFVNMEDVMKVVEESLKYVFQKVLGVELKTPFQRLKYADAIERYGTDKPDLRYGLELIEINNEVFSPVKKSSKHVIKALKARGLNRLLSKPENVDVLNRIMKKYGIKAYGYIAVNGTSEANPSFSKEMSKKIAEYLSAEPGEGIVVAAGGNREVSLALGEVRTFVGKALGLADPRKFSFVWIYDFPLFELDEKGRITPRHHPFTMPNPRDIDKLEQDPLKVKALSYDLVLNGYEVAGGSIRIHERELQERMLKLLGLSNEEMIKRYGFLLEALEYGAPPHGGIAFGLDRLVAVMAGRDSIRDVIAFPKNKEMADPMTGSPAEAPEEYLKDLSWLKVRLS